MEILPELIKNGSQQWKRKDGGEDTRETFLPSKVSTCSVVRVRDELFAKLTTSVKWTVDQLGCIAFKGTLGPKCVSTIQQSPTMEGGSCLCVSILGMGLWRHTRVRCGGGPFTLHFISCLHYSIGMAGKETVVKHQAAPLISKAEQILL